MKICPTHQVKFSEKSPNKAGKFWHVIDFAKQEYCSITKEEYDAIEAPIESREPIIEPKVDCDAKDRQSMAQTAMKSASEIVAALINAKVEMNMTSIDKQVKDMANEFYRELLNMKSSSMGSGED